jgi:hypothetical protein
MVESSDEDSGGKHMRSIPWRRFLLPPPPLIGWHNARTICETSVFKVRMNVVVLLYNDLPK